MAYTVVSFHAHPDDEALLTAGTLARAAAEGHRVVLVLATTGGAGLAGAEVLSRGDLAAQRMSELKRSARALSCVRVVWLGYDDSGLDGSASAGEPFASADVGAAADRLAGFL